jgi:hypothetical protein
MHIDIVRMVAAMRATGCKVTECLADEEVDQIVGTMIGVFRRDGWVLVNVIHCVPMPARH